MPPKKAAPNGFFIYMQEMQAQFRKASGRAPSMREMPGHCRQGWNSMSPDERSVYDKKAKQMKRAQQGTNPDSARKNNLRQYISERVDPVKENEKRRLLENKTMRIDWRSFSKEELCNIKFHVINFQVMFRDETLQCRLPLEIGMVSLTMKDGVIDFMHRFINPGGAPEGYRSLAMQHSGNTHQIPLNFEHSDPNLGKLIEQMEKFLVNDPENDDFPPVFCLSKEREEVELCLEFLYDSTHLQHRVTKVYCLEDLVASLMVLSKPGQPEPSKSQLLDAMQQNRWDYRSEIRCSHHEELDCSFCALSIVKRYSFSVFDFLSGLMGFKLTGNHMPDERETLNTVFHPSEKEFPQNRYRDYSYRDDDVRTVSSRMSNVSVRERSSSPVEQTAPRPYPNVKRVEIHLSDDEISDDSDDDEDDSVLKSEEIRSTVDDYELKELRRPKSVSMAQFAAAKCQVLEEEGGAGDVITPRDHSRPLAGLLHTPALGIGIGRGKAPVIETEDTQEIRPPPGFPSLAAIRGPSPGTAWASMAAKPAGSTSGSIPEFSVPRPATTTNGLPLGRGALLGRGRAPPRVPGSSGLPMGRGRSMPMGRGLYPEN